MYDRNVIFLQILTAKQDDGGEQDHTGIYVIIMCTRTRTLLGSNHVSQAMLEPLCSCNYNYASIPTAARVTCFGPRITEFVEKPPKQC